MNGEVHWFPILSVLLGGASLFPLMLWMARSGRGLEQEPRVFQCPINGERVENIMVRNTQTSMRTGVASCSGSMFGCGVSCGKQCVVLVNAGKALHVLRD